MAQNKQTSRVLEYMELNGGITQMEALQDLGVMRLASRISDLRKMGYIIESEMVKVRNRYDEVCTVKRYFLKAGCGHGGS